MVGVSVNVIGWYAIVYGFLYFGRSKFIRLEPCNCMKKRFFVGIFVGLIIAVSNSFSGLEGRSHLRLLAHLKETEQLV